MIHNQRSVIDEDPFEEMTDAQMLAMFDMIEKEVETKIDERIDQQLGAYNKDMANLRSELEELKRNYDTLDEEASPGAKKRDREKVQNE